MNLCVLTSVVVVTQSLLESLSVTGVILDTREHGPSRSAGAIVNEVTIITFYLDREHGWCAPALSDDTAVQTAVTEHCAS